MACKAGKACEACEACELLRMPWWWRGTLHAAGTRGWSSASLAATRLGQFVGGAGGATRAAGRRLHLAASTPPPCRVSAEPAWATAGAPAAQCTARTWYGGRSQRAILSHQLSHSGTRPRTQTQRRSDAATPPSACGFGTPLISSLTTHPPPRQSRGTRQTTAAPRPTAGSTSAPAASTTPDKAYPMTNGNASAHRASRRVIGQGGRGAMEPD